MNLVPAAVEKIITEGQCRVCTRKDIQTSHLWPRGRGAPKYEDPDICIPLCAYHHFWFDAHQLELLPYLSLEEQLATVREAGGIVKAYRRLTYDADTSGIL